MGDYRDLLREALGLQQAGKFAEAAAGYRRVLAELPDEPNATYLLGVTLHQRGDSQAAIPLLERAVAQRPEFPDACNNLGDALRAVRRFKDAIARFERALELRPNEPAFLTNASHAYLADGKPGEATTLARRALASDRNFAPAYLALGNALVNIGDVRGARDAFEAAHRAWPHFAEATANLAQLEARYGDAERAIALFGELPEDWPGARETRARLYARRGDLSSARDILLALLTTGDPVANLRRSSTVLFEANYEIDDPETLAELHREWGRTLEAAVVPDQAAPAIGRSPRAKLRVGIVSNDLKNHSCAHFLLPVLEGFDPAAIEVFAYSDTAYPDAITQRLKANCVGWRETHGIDDSTLAAFVRRDALDVLVDLGGHTADNRLGVFARRVAPVQVSWLGYPNTTGLRRIDWRFTDWIADPPGAEKDHSERLWRLTGGFLRFAPFGKSPAPARAQSARGFRFGSFNAIEKISPACWRNWVEILNASPDSTLTLKAFGLKDPGTHDVWRRRVRDAGLGERVRLVPYIEDDAEHLDLYGQIDLALDTAPYAGTTTSCEALWMGVPLLTLAGNRHAARVGASLLAMIPDAGVVVADWDAYRERAIALSANSDEYRRLSQNLISRVRASALADGKTLAAEIHEAFMRMV